MTPDETTNIDDTARAKTRSMIRKAMGVLREIAEDPVQRAQYDKRLEVMRQGRKIEPDPRADMAEDFTERQAGEFVRRIHFFQWLPEQPRTPSEDLVNLTLEELQRLADELRQRVSSPS